MKISIIIPVYNVEKYLDKCIESILAQTHKELEIILVNDGSTDSSAEICERYKNIDSRINLINQPNKGLMAAWKTGLKHASSKYIGFVDSDDWIDSNMYEVLVQNVLQHDADIALCYYIKEYFNGIQEKEIVRLDAGIYDEQQIKSQILPFIISDGTCLGRKLSPNRVTKLISKELLMNNMCFFNDDISLGEDLTSMFACVCDAKKIVVLENFFPYHYRMNQNSITFSYDNNWIDKILKLKNQLEFISHNKNIDVSNQIANDVVSLFILYCEIEIGYSKNSIHSIIKKIKEMLKSDLFLVSYKKSVTTNFSIKNKCYLICIKYKQIWLMALIGKLLQIIRQFKSKTELVNV